jgi:hypothetical protein
LLQRGISTVTAQSLPAHLRPGIRTAAVALLLTLFLLVYLRPYYGIRHDSVLYFGQAMLRWKPEQFAKDLFFGFGGQAEYTLFPHLAAGLMHLFPADGVFLALTVFGRFAFLAASYILLRRILPQRDAYWGLLSILIMPSFYGGLEIFAYAETFATARTLAEPLALLALAAALQRRWLWTVTAWSIAALLHPLQAISAALIIWVLQLIRMGWPWLHSLWFVVLGALLVTAVGNEPASLFARYDALWLESVISGPKQVFVMHWQWQDACYLLTDIFLVALVLRHASGSLQEMARASIVATCIGFASSIILGDLMRLVIPTGLQFWRVQWMLHWLAMATIPWQAMRLLRAGAPEGPRFLALIGIAVLGSPQGPSSSPVAVLLLIPLFLTWPRLRNRMRPAMTSVLKSAIVAALLVAYVRYGLIVIDKFGQHGSDREVLRLEYLLMSHPLVIAPLVIAAILAWRSGHRAMRAGLVAFGIAWLAYAIGDWDRRNTLVRHVEGASVGNPLFGVELDQGGNVLWAHDMHIEPLLATWMALGRPSYYNEMQSAGVPFSREMAIELHAREKVVEVFKLQAAICSVMNELTRSPRSCAPDENAMREICEAAEGKLNYVVLKQELKFGVFGRWSIPAERWGDLPATYYLYRCSDFAPRLSATPVAGVTARGT